LLHLELAQWPVSGSAELQRMSCTLVRFYVAKYTCTRVAPKVAAQTIEAFGKDESASQRPKLIHGTSPVEIISAEMLSRCKISRFAGEFEPLPGATDQIRSFDPVVLASART
jgi:hypothetical protein